MAYYHIIIALCILILSLLNKIPQRIDSSVRNGIPILLYHSIDNKQSRYSVSPDTFHHHLGKLYKAGYATVKLEDIVTDKYIGKIKNKKPLVLRFDDSRRSHFRYIKDAQDNLVIDPTCAVGILLNFSQDHPDFGHHALFCIIAGEEFHQPRWVKQKITFLLNNGMEIANHSYHHNDLHHAQPEDIDKAFGQAMAHWHHTLGPLADAIKIIAPPFGSPPSSQEAKNRLKNFAWHNKQYKPLAIIYAGRKYTRLCPLPTSKEFDPFDLPSIEITHSNFDDILKVISNS
jgi:peptidoglycan/xylan/chitin deacetylase (PgdA/CDA1 family)